MFEIKIITKDDSLLEKKNRISIVLKEFFTVFRFLRTTSQEDTLFILSNTEDYSFRYDL